jgi:hypothetical protein
LALPIINTLRFLRFSAHAAGLMIKFSGTNKQVARFMAFPAKNWGRRQHPKRFHTPWAITENDTVAFFKSNPSKPL